ncbi:hypothetical protein LguiA_007113 [Lonicera macranthoides]
MIDHGSPMIDHEAFWNSLEDHDRSWPSMIDHGSQKPFVTIFQWDLPQALEDEYLGFLNETIVDDFHNYAELCFQLFGDRVKNWITINEPWSYSTMGYAQGLFPPNRCGPDGQINPALGFSPGRFASYAAQAKCTTGNSGTEPYNVSHNLLLSHAAAVDVCRKTYQKSQKGQIGISLCTQWFKPRNTSHPKDQYAKDQAIAFMYGWFMEPLASGTYTEQTIKHVGNRLPTFTTNQSELVKGSADFIGLNYYTAQYVADMTCVDNKTYMTDPCAFVSNGGVLLREGDGLDRGKNAHEIDGLDQVGLPIGEDG